MTRYRVSVDIGGTCTDFVINDSKTGTAFTGKVLSTPQDPAEGVMDGLTDMIPESPAIEFLVHGTTVGLNAFLERRGTRVLLITTEGFRDVYIIARGDRKCLYDLQYSKPEPLVSPQDIRTVRERMRWDGTEQEPLHEDDLDPIISTIEAEGIGSVAICLLHAFVNPAHELRIREILQQRAPDVSVSLSHEVAREWREYERTSTTVLNAYVSPAIGRYLENLEERLRTAGVGAQLHVMQSNGGVMKSTAARDLPIQTLLSGPVGGAIGGKTLGEALSRPNLICVDMGGTSFDVSLVVEGRLSISTETALEGLPLLMPTVDIHTIGAGGGSLAWLEAGALRVGPRSAGADPGPACYGRGGSEAAVTDASLVLGRMNPAYFLGGTVDLDVEAADKAIGIMADELGLSKIALAEGILAIVNAKMADAIRTITVKQGIDPRDYSLVAYGGAGPMHAVALAEELGIRDVIVPWSPGTFSAWGMLQSDIRHDVARTFYSHVTATDADDVEDVFAELETQGRIMLEGEGVPSERMEFVFTADMRYIGQEYFVNVVAPGGSAFSRENLDEIVHRFHKAYESRYGHSTPGAPVEIVNLRVAALGGLPGTMDGFRPSRKNDDSGAIRHVTFDGRAHDADILRRDRLEPGGTFSGPAIVEEQTATTVVPPGWSGTIDDLGNIILTLGAEKPTTES
jgi:N-methylhydantoinase A